MSKEKKKVLELTIYEDGTFLAYDAKSDRTIKGKTNPVAVLGSFLFMALASIGTE